MPLVFVVQVPPFWHGLDAQFGGFTRGVFVATGARELVDVTARVVVVAAVAGARELVDVTTCVGVVVVVVAGG